MLVDSSASSAAEVKAVRFIGVPAALYARTAQYHDELMREVRLVLMLEGEQRAKYPQPFLDAATMLLDDFEDFAMPSRDVFERASESGVDTVDVSVEFSVDRITWLRVFRDRFRVLDTFCATGALLTVEPEFSAAALREWWLGQCIDQLEGQAPRAFALRDH